jgi:hypothetical protein
MASNYDAKVSGGLTEGYGEGEVIFTKLKIS